MAITFETQQEYVAWARNKETTAKTRGHLSDADWFRLRTGFAKQAISRQSYFDVLDEFITVDQALAIGYEEPEIYVEATIDLDRLNVRRHQRLRSQARAGKVPRKCMCGCDLMTKGGRFYPGHDAKAKGMINRAFKAGTTDQLSDELYGYGIERGVLSPK